MTAPFPLEHPLSAFGIGASAETAYVRLLDGHDLARGSDADELIAAGLVAPGPSGVVPLSIDALLADRARKRAAEDATARAAAAPLRALYDAYLATSESSTVVQVIRGSSSIARIAAELTRAAHTRIDELIRGPFVTGPEPQLPEEQPEVMERGVAYRVVYAAALLRTPKLAAVIRESLAAGEDARAIADVPIRLMIVDDSRALVVLPHPGNDPSGLVAADADGLLVERSPMLDALRRLFDETWVRGSSLTHVRDGDDDERRGMLTLLSLGLTDAAIARTLGISERTVHRRVAAIAAELGVSGRFQLGVEATKRGLLG